VTAQPIPVMNDDNTNMMFYEDVRIGADRLIGELDRGFYGILAMLNYERIGTGAVCLGWGNAALEYVIQYAKTREAFGGVIGRFQAVQQQIARMHLLIEQARWLVYRAASLQAQGRPCGMEATGAKAIAAENVFTACDLGLQVLGGLGYTTECEVNRYWRKSRLYRLAPVSNEMALNFVAEGLGLPKSY
jgi:acyl-CoA dehydrogenase